MQISGAGIYNETAMQIMKASAQFGPAAVKEGRDAGQLDMGFVADSMSSVSVSAYGKQLNAFHEQLNAIQDPEVRDKALQGLQTLAHDIASDPDALRTTNLVTSLKDFMASDSGFFQEFFTDLDNIGDAGLSTSLFIDTFVRIDGADQQKAFVREGGAIATAETGDENLRHAAYAEFIHGVNRTLDSGLQGDALNQRLDAYFNGLNEAADLEAKREFAAGFGMDGFPGSP